MFFSHLHVLSPVKAADRQQRTSKRMRLCKFELGLFSNNYKSYWCGFFQCLQGNTEEMRCGKMDILGGMI